MFDIRRLAVRLNDIGSKIRSATLTKAVRDRSAELRKPDFTLEHALRDLDQAADALESVKVYAVAKPLDWHEQKLWNESAHFRQDRKQRVAENIARGILDSIQFDLIETDAPNVKALMGQLAIVTAEQQAFTADIEAAFQAGAELMRRRLRERLIDMRRSGKGQSMAPLESLEQMIDATSTARVEAPEHMRR
jgi:hypothetical protein